MQIRRTMWRGFSSLMQKSRFCGLRWENCVLVVTESVPLIVYLFFQNFGSFVRSRCPSVCGCCGTFLQYAFRKPSQYMTEQEFGHFLRAYMEQRLRVGFNALSHTENMKNSLSLSLIFVYGHKFTHICIRTHPHTNSHSHPHSHPHIYTHTYIHTPSRTHTYG